MPPTTSKSLVPSGTWIDGIARENIFMHRRIGHHDGWNARRHSAQDLTKDVLFGSQREFGSIVP
jgi:hypothetical protein